ncbi:hypothetical protein V8E54_004630 [Elaphomyces granulatus]
MGYLARIRKGEAKDAMDSTITTIEKTQGPRHHSDPLEAPRQAGGEKAPCVHNEPVIGRQPRHSSMHPGASSPAERRDFDASIHTLGAMASKLGVGPSKIGRRSFAEPESLQVSGIPGPRRSAYGSRSFCEFGDKGWGNGITVNIADTATESRPLGVFESTYCPRRPRKEYCFIRLIL